MEKTEYESLKKRFDQSCSKKTMWESLYREAYEYVAPEREFFTEKVSGSKRRDEQKVVDSTPQTALNKFVSNLQSSLVPPMRKWIRLIPGESIPSEILDNVKNNLDFVTNIMFSCINSSNFNTQIAECFTDLGIGTASLLVLKGENAQNPLRFVCVPLNEIYLEAGPYGKVDTVFRKHKVEARNIKGTWDDMNIPEDLAKTIEERPSEQITFIECTYPAKITVKKLRDENGTDADGNPTTKQVLREEIIDGFKYVVLYEKGKKVVLERDQESSPWVNFRWSVAPGEIYGRGVVLSALADIKSINKTKELILKRASIDAAGMWTIEEDGIMNPNNIQMGPHSMIPVMKNPGGMNSPSISPLPIPSGFDITQIVLKDLRTNINEAMFADPLGPIDLPVKTATEVAYRQQELSKRIGSSFGRLQYEFILPLVNRILFVLNEWKLLPTMGEAVMVDGRLVNVKFESPLASAQDQESVMAIQQFVQFLAGVFGPQVAITLIQPDKVIEHMAKYLNIPADIQLTQEQLTALKAKMAQMGQMAEQGMQNQVDNGGSAM